MSCFSDPDIIYPEIPSQWCEVACLYHMAGGCADQVSDLAHDLSDQAGSLSDALYEAAEWLEKFQEVLRSDARCIDDADVDEEDATDNTTLAGLADGLRDYCERAYRTEITKILEIAALADHGQAQLLTQSQKVAA